MGTFKGSHRIGATLAGAALAVGLMAGPAAAATRASAARAEATYVGSTTQRRRAEGNRHRQRAGHPGVLQRGRRLAEVGQEIIDSEPDAQVRHDVGVTMLEWSDKAGDAGCTFS